MCGIAGIISKRNKITNLDDIDKMLLAQKHRGPDDFGIAAFDLANATWQSGKKSFDVLCSGDFTGIIGHNRLSILDLTESGHQPMIHQNGMVAIVYNGEVYNAFDFKEELINDGFSFRSETDTEIILNLYIKYGIEKTLSLLNGMFAFCIIDLALKKIFFARDRVGIKPLYYYDTSSEFVFASEIKSIIERKSVKHEIDIDAVEEYFTFRSCLADSLIKGICQVKPGEYIEINNDYDIKKIKWFDVNDYFRKNALKGNYEEIIEHAVNRQMISDVKVGCQLSGGIDSSLVSYFAKKTGYDDAVSIVFDDLEFSEEKYIDFVTEKLDIKSHKKTLNVDYIIENWERMNWHMDTIVNHPNTMGIMALADESKKYVTVLLSGEGADETAGGYSNFIAAHIVDLCKGKTPISKVLRTKYRQIVQDYNDDESLFYLKSHGFTDEKILNRILVKKASGIYKEQRKARIREYTGSAFDKMIKYDIEYYLPELLMRQDKMTMASSIENRVPLLDNKMLEYLLQCNERMVMGWKIPHNFSANIYNFISGKKAMKQISQKVYGKNFTFRKKCGFALPLKELFLNEKFRNYLHTQLFPSMINRGILNCDYIKECLENIDRISKDELEIMWRAFSFETWCQLFIEGRQMQAIK